MCSSDLKIEARYFATEHKRLRSRFPEQNQLEMKDYSTSALLEIGKKIAADNDFLLTELFKGTRFIERRYFRAVRTNCRIV